MAAPFATGQRWEVDPMFGGAAFPTWQLGDIAMRRGSPYHLDGYGCHAAMSGSTPGAPPLGGTGGAGGGVSVASQCAAPGHGCQLRQLINQTEQRDASGRTTVEAALIHVLACPNTGTTYVYQYLNRRAFRVVRPPDWGNEIGGGDFASCEQAQAVAAGGGTPQGAAPGARYYVYVLKGIGLVAATQETVRTRPGCHWAGGGPRPCTAPASVIGSLGGPYSTEAAARADMRTKLDCQRGHWGTFIPYGSNDRAWLQNNITGSDCRSMKQL